MSKKETTKKILCLEDTIKEIKTLKINSASDFQTIARMHRNLEVVRKAIFRLEVSSLIIQNILIKNKLTTQKSFDKLITKEANGIVKRRKKEIAEKEATKKKERKKKEKSELPK